LTRVPGPRPGPVAHPGAVAVPAAITALRSSGNRALSMRNGWHADDCAATRRDHDRMSSGAYDHSDL